MELKELTGSHIQMLWPPLTLTFTCSACWLNCPATMSNQGVPSIQASLPDCYSRPTSVSETSSHPCLLLTIPSTTKAYVTVMGLREHQSQVQLLPAQQLQLHNSSDAVCPPSFKALSMLCMDGSFSKGKVGTGNISFSQQRQLCSRRVQPHWNSGAHCEQNHYDHKGMRNRSIGGYFLWLL